MEDLDIEISNKLLVKERQSEELFKLKVEAQVKVRELGELDCSISDLRNKCKVLKKKNTINVKE